MKDNYSKANNDRTSTQLVIANISSLTLLLSAVLVLGALCRFFKRCWKKVSGKHRPEHDVIAFKPVMTKPKLRKWNSTSNIESVSNNILRENGIPFDAEEVTIQPERVDLGETSSRPRLPTVVKGQRQRKSGYVSRSMKLPSKPRGSLTPWSSQLDIMSCHLEPSLYKREASLRRFQDSQDEKKCGTINIELYFDAETLKLEVKVINFYQTLTDGYMPANNSYVTVKKLPGRDIQRTAIHTQALNPEFNDTFTFQIQPNDDVHTNVLIFEVYHMDRFSTSFPRGLACLPLFQVDITSHRSLVLPFVDPQRSFLSTFHPAYRSSVTGTLLVSLEYQPEKDIIVVNPVEVCNVPKKKHGGYDKDVYMKVVLRHGGKKLMKLKSKPKEMKQMSGNSHFYEARFDEPLHLDVQSIEAKESDITISLNHYLFLKSSFIIGQIRISMTETNYQATHLQGIFESPNEQISTWYDMMGFNTSTDME